MENDFQELKYGSFTLDVDDNDDILHLDVSLELTDINSEMFPTHRYQVKGKHTIAGPFTFFVEHNEHCNWISEDHPDFISDELIYLIGSKIDQHSL